VSPLPLDIDELKLTLTAAIETIGRNMLEYEMRWITDWTFVGSRMELTLSIFRGTSYNCIAVILTYPGITN
jgi:hypothetical protein